MNDFLERLKQIGMRATAEYFDDLSARAAKNRWSHVELLEQILDLEEKQRAKNSLERRMALNGLGTSPRSRSM